VPGHGKWWFDRKTGSDKHYCQQCMHSIITPEAVDSGNHMLSTKRIDHSRVLVAVSPTTECVRMLSDTARINGIKSKGMQASCKGNGLMEHSDYEWYTMDDVPPVPNYKIVFLKGKLNGIRVYYNIRTDPDLGLGCLALWCIACGYNACKEQLRRPWLLCIDMFEQPQYTQNNKCILWPSYEGVNNWKICQLFPVTDNNEKGAQDLILCILIAMDAWMSLMVREGEVGAIGTTDKAAMGYYLVKWLSKPYALQADTEGMSSIIIAGLMVVDALYFNRVERAPYWYMQSGETTVVEVRHVLRTGLEMEEVSTRNELTQACKRLDATRKKACKIASQDHEAIMEEAGKHNSLEYNNNKDSSHEEDKSEVEIDG
jgi:hypothetical protein